MPDRRQPAGCRPAAALSNANRPILSTGNPDRKPADRHDSLPWTWPLDLAA